MTLHVPNDITTALIGLVVTAIGGLGLVVYAWFKRISASIAAVKESSQTAAEESAAAREQVKNSHGTNLRDDVDKVLSGVERMGEKFDLLKDSVDSGRADRKLMHQSLGDMREDLSILKTDVCDLKTMYAAALDEHKEIWTAIDEMKRVR